MSISQKCINDDLIFSFVLPPTGDGAGEIYIHDAELSEWRMKTIRTELLDGKITRKEFARKVFIEERKVERGRIQEDAKRMMRDFSVEIFRDLMESDYETDAELKGSVEITMERLNELREFCNEVMRNEIPKCGGRVKKIPEFNREFEMKNKIY